MMARWTTIDLNGSDRDFVHHIIVRKDLTSGQQLAQVAHAAGESAEPKPEPGCIAVVLHARDELHLKCLAEKLYESDIPYHEVVEGDGPHAGQLMSLGLHPTTDRDRVKRVLSSLPLAR